MPTHEPCLSGTKICKSCNRELHVLSFAVHRRNTDGLMSECRECHRPKVRHRKSYLSLRDAAIEKKKEDTEFHNQLYYKIPRVGLLEDLALASRIIYRAA